MKRDSNGTHVTGKTHTHTHRHTVTRVQAKEANDVCKHKDKDVSVYRLLGLLRDEYLLRREKEEEGGGGVGKLSCYAYTYRDQGEEGEIPSILPSRLRLSRGLEPNRPGQTGRSMAQSRDEGERN